jgi:hypothetical protein
MRNNNWSVAIGKRGSNKMAWCWSAAVVQEMALGGSFSLGSVVWNERKILFETFHIQNCVLFRSCLENILITLPGGIFR